MESSVKYQKLAGEYAKLRAQASVLKKAVLDEQLRSTTLRAELRRAEQEKDSLGFRNKQLEHRVKVLQDEIATREGRSREKDNTRKGIHKRMQSETDHIAKNALIFEELQMKIIENAQLILSIDDKERDLQLHRDRIAHLEEILEIRDCDQSDVEKQLRRDLEIQQSRNTELGIKLVEAASMLGSDDALSVSFSETTPLTSLHHNRLLQSSSTSLHHNHLLQCSSTLLEMHSVEERAALLEKEVLHWRTQYEMAKINQARSRNCENNTQLNDSVKEAMHLDSCSTAAACIAVKPSLTTSRSAQVTPESFQEPPETSIKEQLIYNNFSNKFEDLIRAKILAESRVYTYEEEAEHLQNCLENATYELKAKDDQMLIMSQALRVIEDDLATTRLNYEEQISIMTEQLINLSDQLAACK